MGDKRTREEVLEEIRALYERLKKTDDEIRQEALKEEVAALKKEHDETKSKVQTLLEKIGSSFFADDEDDEDDD